MQIPPERDIDHEMEIVLRAFPMAKSPYKMSMSEAKELKEQLCQLLEHEFI